MYNPFSLEGKRILVTGASSGIGKAISLECAKLGATLILTGRNVERLSETQTQLIGCGHKSIVADLTRLEDVRTLVSSIDSLDGIVLSAGINDKSLIKFLSDKHISNMLTTNFVAPVQLIQQIIRAKKIAKEASIVVISSLAAFYPSIANGMYASSKAALTQFSKVLALELLPQRIRVNCIEPAFVETDMVKKPEIIDTINSIRDKSPFGRLISPEEVALAAAFFLSDATKLITGSELVMDGGFIIDR